MRYLGVSVMMNTRDSQDLKGAVHPGRKPSHWCFLLFSSSFRFRASRRLKKRQSLSRSGNVLEMNYTVFTFEQRPSMGAPGIAAG